MSRVNAMYEQAFTAAESAVLAENNNEPDVAIGLFQEAIDIFSRLAIVETSSKRTLLQEQITDFHQRIAELKQEKIDSLNVVATPLNETTSNVHIDEGIRFESEAEKIEMENSSDIPSILQLYMNAADKFIEALKDTTLSSDTSQNLRTRVESIITKITELQKRGRNTTELEMLDEALLDEIDMFDDEEILAPEIKSPRQLPIASRPFEVKLETPPMNEPKYTEEELDVLRRSSIINGRLFQPWISSDIHESFDKNEQYVDHDGFLTMSSKQMEKLDKWIRPTGYGTYQPCMVAEISPYVIVQDIVTDCSFVASLCITAAYELRFNKKLITKIIYPQDINGNPEINPGGKYIVKLWANGVPRKVVVDDFLPLGHSGSLLCSCTTTSNELWVSIIEKAYLKVNGGYDFPGSNSGIDLFALTGWIPESISFIDSDEYNSDIIWQRLISAHNFGDCLITVSTGDMSKEEAKRVGLVPSHAYAVLNVVETSTNKRLLQVKNPWNRKRWKGPYGIDDTINWTNELQNELKFNLENKKQSKDDGLFWIDFPSIQKHFSALFLNWNPELFQYRYTIHKHWPIDIGPQNDTYNLGYNPQYLLQFQNINRKKKSCSVWILLSRHVTTIETPQTTQQFLTLHVYKQKERVYYPNDAYIRGTYSNNPHSLTCLDIELNEDESLSFILVASQYEKLLPLDYTISVFSTDEPFQFMDAPLSPPQRLNFLDEWTDTTAGGCPRYSTFLKNPQYQFIVEKDIEHLVMTLEAPIDFAINLRCIQDGQRLGTIIKKNIIGHSGEYRPGFCYIEIKNISCGYYTIIASTYEPNCIGSFSFQIASSSTTYKLFALPCEGYNMIETIYNGKWNSLTGTSVGCSNYGQYNMNPQYLIHILKKSKFFIRLKSNDTILPSINISMYQSNCILNDSKNNPTNAYLTSTNGSYTSSPCGVRTPLANIPIGYYIVIPSTFQPQHCNFELFFYSDSIIEINRLR